MVPNHTNFSARCPYININILILCFLIINIGYLILQNGQKITLERVEKNDNGRNNTRIIQVYKKEHHPSQSLEYIYNHYNNKERKFHHWKEYASHYDFHLKLLLKMLNNSKTFRMLEIGLLHGGSIEVWEKYFSRMDFKYVGMDINPDCKHFEDGTRNIFIEIGSQNSATDLMKICQKHGPFDFIVDDGGHTYDMMNTSIETLFTTDLCMTRKSLYVIEDMHTMVQKGRFSQHQGDIPGIPAEIFRRVHYYWSLRKDGYGFNPRWSIFKESDKIWADRVESITEYDSMMFIHRGVGSGPLTPIVKG